MKTTRSMKTIRSVKPICSLAFTILLSFAIVALGQSGDLADSYELQGPILDIEAMPNGAILVTDGVTVRELSAEGVRDVAVIPTAERVVVNGLAATGDDGFLAATGGGDLAEGAAVWRVSGDSVELAASVEAFEMAHDPDALAGSRWKNVACEEDPAQSYSAGPQSNPYHLAVRPDGGALVADAAGNTLLSMSPAGEVDWVAVFEPPVDENGDWRVLKTAENAPEIACYVQPVPTSVAIGPDGALYVGELTGAPAVPGWSRVWRIEPGAGHVVCPSTECREAVSGLTAVIDVAFGPDGSLYVAELDAAGWLAPLTGDATGGVIRRCDVDAGTCEVVEDAEGQLGAIAFDAGGDLWTVENQNVFAPAPAVVRRVALP